jgi:preprotein translocase subunit SecF
VEFFRNTNIDFLGKKWYFLAFSLVFSVAGLFSMLFWHHIPYGVDFRGGTLVDVKFSHTPNDNALRAAMDRAGLHNAKIQTYDNPSNNEVLIDLDVQETDQDRGKTQIINTLEANATPGKQDLNNSSFLTIKGYLMDKDPMRLGSDADQKYSQQAQAIADTRDKVQGGVLSSFALLQGAVDPAVVASLPDHFFFVGFWGAQRRDRRAAGGGAAAQTGLAGDCLFAGWNVDLPGVPLRVDLRCCRGGHRLSRYPDHDRRVFPAEQGYFPYRYRRHPHPHWLL